MVGIDVDCSGALGCGGWGNDADCDGNIPKSFAPADNSNDASREVQQNPAVNRVDVVVAVAILWEVDDEAAAEVTPAAVQQFCLLPLDVEDESSSYKAEAACHTPPPPAVTFVRPTVRSLSIDDEWTMRIPII